MAYAFKALLSSEMKGLVFPCEGPGAVPFGNSYTNDTYRACTIAGHVPGQPLQVRGEDYLASFYNYNVGDMNIDIIAVLLFWIVYICVNCGAMELLDLQAGMNRITSIKTPLTLFVLRWIHTPSVQKRKSSKTK